MIHRTPPSCARHPRRGQKARVRPRLAVALALACFDLAACDDPGGGPTFDADGGVAGAAAGLVTVHTETTNLPALIASATLSLGSMQARNDREPGSFATVALGAPIGLGADDPTPLVGATPATYGGVRLVALDALTIATGTGATVVVDFVDVPPIELRCAGPGTYLPVAGQIDLTLALDFSAIQSQLTLAGYYPPTVPLRTVTNPAEVATLLAALTDGLTVDCAP